MFLALCLSLTVKLGIIPHFQKEATVFLIFRRGSACVAFPAGIRYNDCGKEADSDGEDGSLTVIKSKNIGKPLKYGFFFVKFLFLYVVCVVIMI